MKHMIEVRARRMVYIREHQSEFSDADREWAAGTITIENPRASMPNEPATLEVDPAEYLSGAT